MARRKNFSGRIEARRAEALKRQEVRNGRSALEQLMLLDKCLGKGVGAKKERAGLETLKS